MSGRGLSMSIARGVGALLGIGGILGTLYALVVRGSLTIDLRLGRRVRPLGPLIVQIRAPREVVFEIIAAPYLRRTPRALQNKLRVIERGEDMVLAEHFTPAGPLTAMTLETVRFSPPERVDFRLVRGPVPYVVEHFLLQDWEAGTELEYGGELGTDLWFLGELWARLVAPAWEKAVQSSLDAVRIEAERRSNVRPAVSQVPG